ncbi:MAG: alanine--tRNA ligase, partial [Bacteroidales bacterium]|nr:alanine--tRNA ligase [Bacteroidales bacterium]
EFTGYDETITYGARLLKHRTVVQKNKEMLQLVFDRTPFYGEMGGEVGDTGSVVAENGDKIVILNTVKENGLTIHIADKLPTDCRGTFTMCVNAPRRQKIANNHSCTHLLHQALREILGTHVEQKGSFVTDAYFRFDFSHFEKMSDEQLAKVEARVNELIRANNKLDEKRDATMDEAKKMGAMALFGEKYGDSVRVVRFGNSVELCGGCHTSATGNIGLFKIVSESAIAAGIRRIEAITGEEALQWMNRMENSVREAKALLNNSQDLAAGIQKLLSENAAYKKLADEYAKEKTLSLKKDIVAKTVEKDGVRRAFIDGEADASQLRNALTMLQKEEKALAVAAAVLSEGRPQLLVMYSADLVAGQKADAVALIREAARFIQGGGGGQAGLATAGGKNASGLAEALDLLRKKL